MTSSSLPNLLEIRPARCDDVPTPELPAIPADQDGPDWQRSVVAATDGRLVGVASITLDAVSDTYLAEVDVAPDFRRRGIGTALFAAVCERAVDPYPVRARVMSSLPLRGQFAAALGASVVTQCPEPWVEPRSEAARDWAARQATPVGYRIRPMADVKTDDVAEAWATYYAWAHRPFGVVHADRIRSRWDRYVRGVDPTSSMIATDGARAVAAFSLVSPDGWQGRTFIVSETVDPDEPDGDALLRATVAASVRALAHHGTSLVELEGHTTDPHSPAIFRSVPRAGADPMNLVELKS